MCIYIYIYIYTTVCVDPCTTCTEFSGCDLAGIDLMDSTFEILNPDVDPDFETNISKAAGLPDHINHLAFDVADLSELNHRKNQWLDSGCDVLEVDHNWCRSIYTKDPNDNLVEFCLTTGEFNKEDRAFALEQLRSEHPTYSAPPKSTEHHKKQSNSE